MVVAWSLVWWAASVISTVFKWECFQWGTSAPLTGSTNARKTVRQRTTKEIAQH